MIKRTIEKIIGLRLAYKISYLLNKRYILDDLSSYFPLGKRKQKVGKVGIIFIGTGSYINFFRRYYHSIKENFLPKKKKIFLVFTDSIKREELKEKDIEIYRMKHEKFPMCSLKRYEMISKIKNENRFTHLFYIDADMYVNTKVYEEELFKHEKEIIAVRHHAYVNWRKKPDYEKNKLSRAYLGRDYGTYFQASFWGGKRKRIMEMVRKLGEDVEIDLEEGIIAKWHDESYLNKYFAENWEEIYELPCAFSYPSLKKIPKPYEKRIVHITKNEKDRLK